MAVDGDAALAWPITPPWQETSVTVAQLMGALVLIGYWGVILAGVFRSPVKGEEATSNTC
jgi:hypothetical protein